MWSCCLQESADASGCSEDSSLLQRHSLLIRPITHYKPHSTFVNHLESQKLERWKRPQSSRSYLNRESDSMTSSNSSSMFQTNANSKNVSNLDPNSILCKPDPSDDVSMSICSDDENYSFIYNNKLRKKKEAKAVNEAHAKYNHDIKRKAKDLMNRPVLDASAFRVSSNVLMGGMSKPGTIRQGSNTCNINRKCARPLTAHLGPHLHTAVTSAPSSCLSHLTERIV